MTTDSERIDQLTAAIVDSMTVLCTTYNMSDIELYISVRYFLTQLQHAIGPERVKKLEKSFIIVPPPTNGTVC